MPNKLVLQHAENNKALTEPMPFTSRPLSVTFKLSVCSLSLFVAPPAAFLQEYCVRHSQHPLAAEAFSEISGDAALSRTEGPLKQLGVCKHY